MLKIGSAGNDIKRLRSFPVIGGLGIRYVSPDGSEPRPVDSILGLHRARFVQAFSNCHLPYRHPNENALMPSKTELTMPRASIPARQSTSPVRVLASVLKAAIGVSFLLMNIALTTRR